MISAKSKQYTPTELFEMWWSGKYSIVELAKTYGYDPTSLGRRFTVIMGQRKKQIETKPVRNGSLPLCPNCKKTNEIDISILKPPAFIRRTCRYCGYDR